jgi:hypothetical protein
MELVSIETKSLSVWRFRAPYGNQTRFRSKWPLVTRMLGEPQKRRFEQHYLLTGSSVRLAFLVVLFIVVLTELIHAQNLYIVERDDLYGFSDKSGKSVIPPKYRAVKSFSEGLAPVYRDGSWGFIDSDGKVAIDFEFQEAEGFSNGLAAVRKEKWGFIDKNGKEAIPYRFVRARQFSEGMAPVEEQSSWLFIDGTGTPVPGLSGFEDAKSFSDGLAPVQVGEKWRYITPKGDHGFFREFYRASSFSGRLAAVQQEENGKYGFIDRSGEYIVKPTFDDAKPFAEGLAAVRWNKRWGYIRTSGEIKIANVFPLSAENFADGLAAVSSPIDGAPVYIGADGRPQFFKSRKPASIERETGDYAMVSLTASSSPVNVSVYLIPAYIWDFGDGILTPPSQLNDPGLRAFLQQHFDYSFGQTDLQKNIIEQTYVVLFILGENMQRQKLDARIGEHRVSATFDHR